MTRDIRDVSAELNLEGFSPDQHFGMALTGKHPCEGCKNFCYKGKAFKGHDHPCKLCKYKHY